MKSYFSMSSFVGGFMLGALLIGMWTVDVGFSLPFSSASSPAPVKKVAPSESDAIRVTNQSAGSVVMVDSLVVPPPGVWIAVREVNGPSLANVLGAARARGPGIAIPVSLLRSTEPGLLYAVQLYRDDGSETFDLASDSVYIDFATGAPVIVYFTTTN